MPAQRHRTAAGIFALLVFAYLWPVLVGGGALVPVAELYHLAPWQAGAPVGIERYINPALTDVPLSYYPWDVLARQLIRAGTFPAWDTHAFAGTPFFANPEVAWLSPFSLPLWILPLNYGLGVAAALKLWVAAFGTYLLARELRLDFWPGVLAGIAFGLCAFNTTWLSYGVFVSVSALLPWTVLLVERVVRRGRSADGLALAVLVALVLTGGHPGAQVHVIGASVLYGLLRTLTSTDFARRERLRRLALAGAALALGALLTAVVLLPAQQAAAGSAGAVARRSGGIETFIGKGMPFGVLRTLLLPDWWGRTSELILGPANYNERTFYAGALALLFALFALTSLRDWQRKAPFLLLALIGAGAAVRAPGLQTLLDHLPPFDRVQNHRMALWLEFAIALLAGFGLQALLDAPQRLRRAWLVAAGTALVGLLFLATSASLAGGAVGDGLKYMLHRSWSTTTDVLAVASVGWLLVFVAAFAGILLLARRHPQRRALIGGLVVLVAALDMVHFATGYQPMGAASRVVPPVTPAIAYLQRHVDDGRIAGSELVLATDFSTVYGLRDGRGYDAPQPSLRFHSLWQLLSPQQPLHTAYTYEGITSAGLHVLGLLGVRYLVTRPDGQVPMSGLPLLYHGRDAKIFGNPLAMPRAIVARRVRVAANDTEELEAVAADTFNPRRDVVVRQDELVGAAPPASSSPGTVRVLHDENSKVTLQASLPRPGLVVLDDAWAPGWSVKVDGHPATALQADVILRGVMVPAGTHEIAWTYRVPGLRTGALLSLLGLLVVLGWGGRLINSVLGNRRA